MSEASLVSLSSEQILALELPGYEHHGIDTLRDFFAALARKVWIEDEGFDGKRPFGDSEWKWDIYAVLIKANVVTADYEGEEAADRLLAEVLKTL